MDFTARMVALLGAFRRERNGLVADTMHYEGARYGLNFGVSLPTIRTIARRERPDHAFACFLIGQQVRELQLAAFHLADPDYLTDPAEAARWRRALNNTELAEEAAFALLSRSEALPQLLPAWLSDAAAAPLPAYAAMLAAARCEKPSTEWLEPVRRALQGTESKRGAGDARAARAAEAAVEEAAAAAIETEKAPEAEAKISAKETVSKKAKDETEGTAAAAEVAAAAVVPPACAARRLAEGAVAFAARLAETDETTRLRVLEWTERLGSTPTERYVAEELAWRLAR